MKTHIFLNSLIFILIALFTYTAVSKLIEWKAFRDQISRMPVIGNFSGFFAIAIPVSEILLATALTFSNDIKYALWGSFVLLSIFTVYIVVLTSFAPHLPCSCGGVIEQLSWHQHLVFNCLLMVINLMAINYREK